MSQPIPPLDSKLTGALADSGTGALLGFSAGFAVKKVGKVAVFLVGMGFVGVQVAAERGLISVNWSAIDREAKKQLDLNQDGKLDVKDVAYAAKGVERYLERGLPFGGGFGVGFFAGLKAG